MTEERAVEQLKSDFVSTVSHELRTPLAAIYGAALTLQRDDVRLEESQRIGAARRHLERGRPARADRQRHPLGEPARLGADGDRDRELRRRGARDRRRRRGARARARRTSRSSVEAADGLPPVAADPDKLRQVLTNLVDNAVKYSPDGGSVRVSLVAAPATGIRFRVEDQGLGIPPGEQERIFEKFFRLDPNLTRGVGGTGLGLYICRELVHRMHGRIWRRLRRAPRLDVHRRAARRTSMRTRGAARRPPLSCTDSARPSSREGRRGRRRRTSCGGGSSK